MFAPVMTFWNEEAPLHVVKIDRNARDEFGIYMHEIDTERQSDAMYIDWLFDGDDLRYEDPASAAWLEMMTESWDEFFEKQEEELNEREVEEALKDTDHANYGFGCHESDCLDCDARSRVIQLEIDHAHGDRHSKSAGCITCLEDEYRDEGLLGYVDLD